MDTTVPKSTKWRDPMEMELIEADDEAYDPDEVDDMLDALVEGAESDEELSERRNQQVRRLSRTVPLKTALGRSAYRAPAPSGAFVTQKQFSDAMGRVGTDIRRNATGIKTVNTRLSGMVAVNKVQSREIGRLDRQMKMDGVLELVEAYDSASKAIDPYQLLKGVVK